MDSENIDELKQQLKIERSWLDKYRTEYCRILAEKNRLVSENKILKEKIERRDNNDY